MSRYLWRYFLEDDFDSFHQLLEDDGVKGGKQRQKPHGNVPTHSLNSPNLNGPSPVASYKSRGRVERDASFTTTDGKAHISITRADVNSRDLRGLTLLHHAASSSAENARAFALALIAHQHIDLYVQDFENGWTSLHRAFYFGNITIARAILERDLSGAVTTSGPLLHFSSLIKIKDREGYGPYDLLATTIADRSLRSGEDSLRSDDDSSSGDNDATNRSPDRGDIDAVASSSILPSVNVRADEFFTFGSNRNFSLGFGDQDDRQYPERIFLERPKRLFELFNKEYFTRQTEQLKKINPMYAEKLRSHLHGPKEMSNLPDIIRMKPLYVQDVQMAKFHTAVLTTDPIANLYVCGHGVGGRLGTGDEKTLFNFKCLDQFGSQRISSVALGQDHTLIVTNKGELYSWGSNLYGQLGCGLPKENPRTEEVMQLSPKQIFGPMKKEVILDVAASRIHSVAHTGNAVFTFGKNEGQLGLVDSQAGTLKVQSTPRQVYASRLNSNILGISAIDRATVILLENREVHVFANYGAVKLQFPLDGFSNYFLRQSFLTTKYDKSPNKICKVTAGGDTICALSTNGEVYAVTVDQRLDPSASGNTSTTNPNKIRAALSTPHRAWTLKSDRMAARDIGVDADGSIILSTEAGGVFRRIRRPKATNTSSSKSREQKSKEFKFLRVPNLTRAVAVRASASGAYCALREDCNVTRTELDASPPTLRDDLIALLPFKDFISESNTPSFWQRPDDVQKLVERVSQSKDLESDVTTLLRRNKSHIQSCDVIVSSTVSKHVIPAHRFVLAGRSSILRHAFVVLDNEGEYESEIFRVSNGDDGKVIIRFLGVDYLTIFDLVLFSYADALVGFWLLGQKHRAMQQRYRTISHELRRIGAKLEIKNMEFAARSMITRPEPSAAIDFELALLDPAFYADCDACVQLADGELLVHSEIMSRRCPFFEGLFHGRAGGMWLAERRAGINPQEDVIQVDLSHIDVATFKLILRYVYADTGERLFDDLITAGLEEFLGAVMDVLSAANELMLDNLSQTCQIVLGRHVTTRNACQLLNAVAPSSVTSFKDVTLEYLCLSLEPLLANHWLDELEPDLLGELDAVVQENQRAALPYVKSGRIEEMLYENHPELAENVARARQARIDALDFQVRFPNAASSPTSSISRSRPSPTIKPRSASGQTSPVAFAKPQTIPEVSAESLDSLPSPAQNIGSSQDNRSRVDDSSQYQTTANVSRPWGPSPVSGAKLGLKDIMAQASSSRTSSLSIGLQSRDTNERRTVSTGTPKVSQKERKRQQQQQQHTEEAASETPSPLASSSTPHSPWKTVSTPMKSNVSKLSPSPTPSHVNPMPARERSPNTRQLTMRQTVANAPSRKGSDTAPQPSESLRQPQRSVSNPISSDTQGPSRTTQNVQGSPSPQIKSIRHQPRPDSFTDPETNASLADIMSREQAVKTGLKDAIAKRSLNEIQEEQAFQEWWDKESQAVQEAQRQAESASNNPRGRGKSRGRGRSRGRAGKQRGDAAGESKSKK